MRFLALTVLFSWMVASVCAQESVIRANDLLRITVEGESRLSRTYRVGTDGTVLIDFIGAVKVGGMSTGAAGKLIADTLRSKDILKDPKVTVEPVQNSVYVSGAVKNPGSYPLTAGMRLSDVMLQASPNADADLTGVRLGRADGTRITIDFKGAGSSVDPSLNPEMQPGDQVFVVQRASSENVMVLGAVKSPQVVAYEPEMKLSAAIRKAGGETADADITKIKLTRRSSGQAEIVDITQVNADVELNAGDHVFVPQRAAKVYVLIRGAVQRTGLIPFKEGMTLREAVELANPSDEAQLHKITVERAEGTSRAKKTTVSYTEILRGQREDYPLRAGDVIDVPYPPRKLTTPETLQTVSLILGILLLFVRR